MKVGRLYHEFHGSIRIQILFGIVILDFPIVAIVKYDNPHNPTWHTYSFALIGFAFSYPKELII
jgi:hypothetical protein